MKGRVLVTGATGMLGNNVTRVLVNDGWQVSVLVRNGYDTRCFQDLEVEILLGDVSEPRPLDFGAHSLQAIVHCAGVVQVGWSSNEGHREVNVDGTRRIVEMAIAKGITLVHVSSVNALAFGRRPMVADEETSLTGEEVLCNYVLSKRVSDEIVRQAIATRGLSATIVHPGFMLGPWDWKPSSGKMLQQLAAGRALLAPPGGCSVCDVRDVAAGIVACLESPGSDRYVMAGHNVSYLDLWCAMASEIGVRKPIGVFGPVVSQVAGRLGDSWGWVTRREPVVNSAAIAMSNCFHYFSSDLAKRELNYRARSWEESIRDAWRWIQADHSH